MTKKKTKERKKQKKKKEAKRRVLNRREEIRAEARVKKETDLLSYKYRERIKPIRNSDKQSNETTT